MTDIEKSAQDKVDSLSRTSSDNLTAEERQAKLVELDAQHAIKYKSMSWQTCTVMLFTEYVCLAILAFPWSFKILGMVPGIIVTIVVGLITLYTSYTLWQYQLRHPDTLDICDIGYRLLGKKRWGYEFTMVMLVLNNVFVMGLHILTGTNALNAITNHPTCSVAYGVVVMVVCFFASLPRTFKDLTWMGIFSAIMMFTAVVVTLSFAGVESVPYGYPDLGEEIIVRAWPAPGTSFVQAFNAVLNITFTFVGQICYPSFIAEMKNPKEFPKALYALTVAEFVLFLVAGGVGYHFLGQYTEAPAVAALSGNYRKIAFGLILPTTVIIGVLYSSVVSRMLFLRIMKPGSRHAQEHTVKGWGVWIAIVASCWFGAFIIAELVPFFGDLLSLMSAIFDSFFGLIFWALAYLSINKGRLWTSPVKSALTVFNYFLILCGVLMFFVGSWTSIQAIIDDYALGNVKRVFAC